MADGRHFKLPLCHVTPIDAVNKYFSLNHELPNISCSTEGNRIAANDERAFMLD